MTIEEDYRSVVHALPVGVMEIDCNGRIVFASPAVQDIFAIHDEQSLTGSRLLDWIHPDDQSKALEHMRWTLQTQEAPVPTEYRLLTCIDNESDNTRFNRKAVLWGEVTFVSLKGPNAAPGHLIVMVRNITESKQLETCLQQNLERQEFLNHLLQLLYRPRDLSMAMEQVLGLIGVHTHARHVYMFENRRDGQFGEIVLEWYSEGAQPRSDDVRVISYSQVPSLRKYLDSRGVACISVAQTLTPDLAALLYSWNIRTFVAIPVYGKERLYGFIAYDDMQITKTWDLEEQDLLRSISRAVSSAIARKQVDEDEREHRILLEVLSDISSVLNSTLSFNDVLSFILSNLERVIPHQAANIALVDERRTLTVADARGYPAELMPKILQFSLPIDRFKTFQRISQTNLC